MADDCDIVWLAEFAKQVRESTLKRLAQVRPEDRCWSPGKRIMSFADTLAHLIEVDRWLLDRLSGKCVPDVDPCPGAGDTIDWDKAVAEFADLGRQREQGILRFTHKDLAGDCPNVGQDGSPMPLWELILRRSLDHEVHHRGELQLMLMLLAARQSKGQ